MKAIPTKDKSGNPNGFLIPVWNVAGEPDARPDQVYVTVVAVGCGKGPHLHMARRGRFACIKGDIKVIVGNKNNPDAYQILASSLNGIIEVPPGCPAEIRNVGDCDAYVINMPSPAWTKDNPDDHEVLGWNP